MRRWLRRLSLLALLAAGWRWPEAAADQCSFALEVGEPTGGGRLVTVRAPEGCRCRRLGLSVWWGVDNLPCDSGTRARARCANKELRGTAYADDDSHMNVTILYDARYQAREQKCECADGNGACGGGRSVHIKSSDRRRISGIQPDKWNASISAEQQPGLPLRVRTWVSRQLGYDNASQFFFPRLTMELYRFDGVRWKWNESKEVSYRPDAGASALWGNGSGLVPGRYRVLVKPAGVFNCQGAKRNCPRVAHEVEVSRPPRELTVLPGDVDQTHVKIALGAVGVVCAAAVVAAVVHRQVSRADRALSPLLFDVSSGKETVPEAEAFSGPVLVLHRGARAGGRGLDELVSRLSGSGLRAVDCQEPAVFRVLQSLPSLADVLALPRFCGARLVFVASRAGDGAAPPAGPRSQLFDGALRHVRNSPLGLDYGRVFFVTLDDAAAPELAGVVPGRLFRAPADVDLLVEHLRAPGAPHPRSEPHVSGPLLNGSTAV